MTVTYLDPTAEEGVAVHAYEFYLDTTKPFTLGLVANTFPDGTRFMDKLESVFAEIAPNAAIKRYLKPGLLPIEGEQLAAIRSECDGVVAGWGH
jgi:hypothetical protein